MRRRQVLALSCGLLCHAAGARALLPRRAWVGARLWTASGKILPDATIVTQGPVIVSVGRGGAVDGAEVVRVGGRIVTPGFVATQVPLGLVEVEAEKSTAHHVAPAARSGGVHAAHSAADAYNPLSSLVSVARRGGVTSAVATPEGGLVAGTSAWADLLHRFPAAAIQREEVALHASVEAGAGRAFALSKLRRVLEAARLYARSPEDYDLGKTRALPLAPMDLRRLARVLRGTLPLVVRVSRAADILRLLELAKAYDIKLVLSGAEEAWMVASQIAEAEVPVVIDPTHNLPASFDRLGSRSDNAVRLHAAGVRISFSTFDAHRVHNLRQLAGNAVAEGLSPAAALAAITREPAAALGMSLRHGDVAAGQRANFVIWTGDPFELRSWASSVVVHGTDMPMHSRQDALFERYRDLGSVPRGVR